MDWSFLDEMDKNLLYFYAKGLNSDTSTVHFQNFNVPPVGITSEQEEILDAEQRRKTAFYIIWFVFRYVLGCETLEQAEALATEEIMQKYKLVSFLHKRRIYIGVYGINEIYLYKYNEGDLNIVLEILYNRYDFFEQLECYIRRTEGTSRTTRSRCIKTYEQCLELIKGKAEYKELLERIEKKGKLW